MTATTRNAAVRKTVFSSATDDWATPPSFFVPLDEEFGFALDVCASSTNHKADAWYGLDHPDASRRNGLAQDWAQEARRLCPENPTVWVNPPYGRAINAWMAKAADTAGQGVTVVALVPARTDTKWFHDNVLAVGGEVRYVRGRLRFGAAKTGAPFASLVVVLGPLALAGRTEEAVA